MALQHINRSDRCLANFQRLKSSRIIAEVFERGRKFAGRFMVLWLRTGEGTSLRLAVAAGRAVGGAVQRNRAKRRLREAFRLSIACFRGGCDIVLVAREGLNQAPWSCLQAELLDLAGRAGILRNGRSKENENG